MLAQDSRGLVGVVAKMLDLQSKKNIRYSVKYGK